MKKIISIVLLILQSTIVFSQNHTVDWLALTSGYDASITTDSSNNIITISKTGGFYADKHLIEKIDSNGNILWTKTLNNTKNQEIKTDIKIFMYTEHSVEQ